MGPRCYLCGYRIHHGFAGACAVLAGLLGMLHDRHDLRHWWPTRGQ